MLVNNQTLQWQCIKVMDLLEDNQNGSLVEKIILRRDGVANICNTLVSKSSTPTADMILFEKLETTKHKAYGVFGHKNTVRKFLQGLGAWEPELPEDNLFDSPGMYAFISTSKPAYRSTDAEGTAGDDTITERHSIYMVVWPKEDAFDIIQALNKTTAFFRYLTKLCQQVFVCLDETCARTFPKDRKIEKISRRHVYKLEETVVQEDSFSLQKGFKLKFKEESHSDGYILPIGGAAVLIGNGVQSKKKLKAWSTEVKLNKNGFINIEDLKVNYSVHLDKMPSSEQKILFRKLSQESYDAVDQLETELRGWQDSSRDRKTKSVGIEEATTSRVDRDIIVPGESLKSGSKQIQSKFKDVRNYVQDKAENLQKRIGVVPQKGKLKCDPQDNLTLQKQKVETEKLSRLCEKHFHVVPGSSHPRLFLSSVKILGYSVVLGGHLEEDDGPRISYKVKHFIIRQHEQTSLLSDRFSKIHPAETDSGKFDLPESMKIINAWLIKDKLLVVSRHLSEAKSDVSAFSIRNGTRYFTKPISRSVHLADFDEKNRLLAIYTYSKSTTEDLETSSFVVYRLNGEFTDFKYATSQCYLQGETELRSMAFLHGCQELALLDCGNRIQFYDVAAQQIKPRDIKLDSELSPLRMFSIEMGVFLMILCRTEGVEGVQVYPFTTSSLRALPPVSIKSQSKGTWEVFEFGEKVRQFHLCLLSSENFVMNSHVLVTTGNEKAQIISETTKIFDDSSRGNSEILMTPLEYIHFVYDKFPIQGEAKLQSSPANPQMTVVFNCDLELFVSNELETRTRNYVKSIFNLLQKTGKSFGDYHLIHTLKVISLDSFQRSILDNSCPMESFVARQNTGDWVRQLICLVPLQIVRAEDNAFNVLTDGILLPKEKARNIQELAKNIKLGVYDAILRWWTGKVLVISSMGKQSTGKSYTLNHLYGLSFEISGARCTDGCWMTMCEGQGEKGEGILYVVLDFEGLGSFERSQQEDMLLSVFNAAISGVTLFKTDLQLGRDTENMFARFQAGVGLIKGEKRLFKGRFCIINKDVPSRDVETVNSEFHSKLQHIIAGNSECNFIKEMYNSDFEIFPFPPLGDPDYFVELGHIDADIRSRLDACQFVSGISFADCMKTIMAKMQLKDWRSLDGMEIETRLRYLEDHLEIALRTGRAELDDFVNEELKYLDKGGMVEELPLQNFLSNGSQETNMDDALKTFLDVSITFPAGGASFIDADVSLEELFDTYESMGSVRTGKAHDIWHNKFSDFVAAICRRRVKRVMTWVEKNLVGFDSKTVETADGREAAVPHRSDVATNFIHQTKIRANKLCEDLTVCKSVCSDCYLFCILPKNHHSSTHSCKGNHRCKELCSFCKLDGHDKICGDKMGHPGEHDCREKYHTCDHPCDLKGSLNCNEVCAGKAGHKKFTTAAERGTGHLCSAKTHLCGQKCSAFGCRGACVITYGLTHTVHKCVAGTCSHKCVVKDCEQICAAPDHFHLSPNSRTFLEETGGALQGGIDKFDGHFCGKDHLCSEPCKSDGICKVTIEAVEGFHNYAGKRSTFIYKAASVAKGEKEVCSVKIPPFKTEHEGPHLHDPRAIHTCDQRCPTCLYFCEKPFGHPGRHHAAHGMMKDCYFVANTEEIDFAQRKYSAGESGEAEMCDMFCRNLGRGHIHLLPCDAEPNSQCSHSAEDGRQHQTCQYIGGSGDGSLRTDKLDELTHESYWTTVNWKDPCSNKERKEFGKCGYTCGDESHFADGEEPSFCSLKLWHPPSTDTKRKSDIVSSDGHLYKCTTHASGGKCHLVFVLDESTSMAGDPWRQLQTAVDGFVVSRLREGQTSDIISIIQYSSKARITADAALITGQKHRNLVRKGRGTNFAVALKTAADIFDRSSILYPFYQPMLLFLSDGRSNSDDDGMYEMRRLKLDFDDKILCYTVAFGKKANVETLEHLAFFGGGEFIQSMNGIELEGSLVEVASNLKNKIALMAAQGKDYQERLSNKPHTVVHEQVHKIEEQKSAENEDSYREEMKAAIAALRKRSKTMEKFLAEIGFPVNPGQVSTALKAAKKKYHPDRNKFAPMEDRVYGEEVTKVLNEPRFGIYAHHN